MTITWRVRGRTLALGDRPWLMGIVNASPDSFSDGGDYPDVESQFERACELVRVGADIIDIGGESAIGGVEPIDPEEEIDRVIGLIHRVVKEVDVPISIDTYKPAVAAAAIE